MRKTMHYVLYATAFLTLFGACKKEKKEETSTTPVNEITDARDGKKYTTVTIGNQTWIGSNLRYASAASLCPPGDCEKYGNYYTGVDAKTACMAGFHLPSDLEWKTLELYLGMLPEDTSLTNYRGMAQMVGKKLKENGSSGLNLKFGGNYILVGGDQVGTFGYYWSSTLNPKDATQSYYRSVKAASEGVNRALLDNAGADSYRLCIRCLKD